MSEVLAAPGRLKESGNKKYANGEVAAAAEEYTKSIELLDSLSLQDEMVGGEEPRKQADLLRATVLTNRAMARYKYGEFEAGELDCNEALELDPGRIKALFKRAQCRERLNKNGDALLDARRLCKMDPDNKEAVALAVLLRDKISKAAETDSLLNRTLKDVIDGDNMVAVERAIKTLLALAAEDHIPISIALMKEAGVTNTIFSLCRQGSVPALRLMGSCFQHRPFGESIVTMLASTAPNDQPQGNNNNNAVLNLLDFASLVVQEGSVEHADELAVSCIFFVLQLVHHDDTLLQQLSEDAGEPNVKMALDRLVSAVATIFATAISSQSAIIRDAGMEAVAQWCPLRNIDDMNADTQNGNPARRTIDPASRGKERASQFRLNEKRRLAARERGLCIARLVANPLYVLLSSTVKDGCEKHKAGATLTLITKAVNVAETVKSSDHEETTNALHAIFEPLMKFGESNDAVDASTSRLTSAIRRVGLVTALAGADMGQWAMAKDHCIDEVMMLSAAGDDIASEVAAEAVCACASFDGGRPLLGPVVQSGVIFSLMDSPSPIARSAAASAYTKLGMVSKALKGDSKDISKLLNVSLDILAKGGGGLKLEKDRAIEVLTILVAKTKVKEELTHGSGRCVASLNRLCDIASQLDGPGPMAFGLATVFKSITISHEEEVKESLKGKDISYEQYEQLRKLAITHGQEDSKEDPLDVDTEEATRGRCVKLVEAGGVPALKRLCSVGGEGGATGGPTLVAACKTFRHLASEPETRGHIVSQGGLSCLQKVSDNNSFNKEARMEARHAIAKTMVSTNPNMIPEESLLGTISSLMALVHDNDSTNLQQFESLLSLTNVASTGESAQKRIAAKKGANAIHYHMFSDHELVRRAATECLSNLLPCKEVLEHMAKENNARLWVAFAGLEEEDLSTTRAACGAIAMASYYEETAMAFIKAGALDTLKEV